MPTLIISEQVRAAIKAAAIFPFEDIAVRVGPGLYEIPISFSTETMLDDFREYGESDDGALRRLLGLPPETRN